MNTGWVLRRNGEIYYYIKQGKVVEFHKDDKKALLEYCAYISPVGTHFHSKESKVEFDKSDRNCNTCKNLQREKHDKCKLGFLKGVCRSTGESIVFHPQDPMFKDCYIHREEV